MMKLCNKCKKTFSNEFEFCPMCGDKLEAQIECPNCKKVFDIDFKFCPYCGTISTMDIDESQSKSGNFDKRNNGVNGISTEKDCDLDPGKKEYDIGNKYFDGDGVEINVKEAVKWFKKAAVLGNSEASNILGEIYYNGFGIEENEEEGLKWYIKSAERGNLNAQLELGRIYEDDEDENYNIEEALRWYSLAAKQGNEEAINEYAYLLNKVGDQYYNGSGVDRDYYRATKCFRKAAELGNRVAQYNLGIAYYNGCGVEKNHSMAAVFFTAAAKQDYVTAQSNLGFMYENGDGVEKNIEEALKWYYKAAEQGSAEVQNRIAELYYFGTGVARDYNQAAYWFTQAAEQGEENAQFDLGVMYENGQGLPKNLEKAIEWYSKAAEQGCEGANESIARVKSKLNKLNKSKNYPHIYLSVLGAKIIDMALNNAFNDNLWQAFGFKETPERGTIFNVFISSEKLAKETFLTREFIIAPIGIFVRYLRKLISFSEKGFISFLTNRIVNINKISDSLKFNDDGTARKYFESYIKDYVIEDSNLYDVFLKHCKDNNLIPDQEMINGAQLVCDSLSNFIKHKIKEIDNKYYINIEHDAAGLGYYTPGKNWFHHFS